MDCGNQFSDIAKRQGEFINWIVKKLEDHEKRLEGFRTYHVQNTERLDDLVVDVDMIKNKVGKTSEEHESRLSSLKEQVRMLNDKIAAGKAPSALKSLATGASKKMLRINSIADDLEAEKSPRPSPEQTALGEDIIEHLEQVTQQMMGAAPLEGAPRAQSATNGSIDSWELPSTLTQAIETTTVGNSPGTAFGARSRRTCMIPKFDDLLEQSDEPTDALGVPYVPRFSQHSKVDTSQLPDPIPDAAVNRNQPAVSTLLSQAKASCLTPGSNMSDDQSPRNRFDSDMSQISVGARRPRGKTEEIDLDAYPLGEYILINKVIVTDGLSSKNSLCRLEEGGLVKVIQVDVDSIRRVRAEIEEPKGWINLRNTATDQTYAEKANKCSKCDKFKSKGLKEADGSWTCADCRGHHRTARRLPQGIERKCDQCSNSVSTTMGRDDGESGHWYCNTCWDGWK